MIAFIANIVIALALAGFFLGGVALFFIARQDDSHAGRIIGIIAALGAALVATTLTAGHHWL